MDSKLNRHLSKAAVSMSFLMLPFLANPAYAVNWVERVDAGNLLGTAQEPTGDGSLNNIRGLLEHNQDIDLFKIYISNPTTFSASVTANFNSVLSLFDSTGLGVYGNDDAKLGDTNAGLPAGHAFGPQAAGWYYLAISTDEVMPTSGSGTGPENYIASITSEPYTAVLGPTGPGGGSPLTGWATEGDPNLGVFESYRIRLSGVTVSPVPEPETYGMLLAGLGLVGAMVRRRKFPTAS
ncbi:PEP-CTERM protein-sorting domain-containing protein [Nitrosovibrio sp. Nv17]|nr:PEP-CTERM protein-sorting domain-containing protein [Nitrosovibrio sp. Nv17]